MTASLKTLTLGCKVNQYETQYVREGLLSAGFHDAAETEPADLCVINTCTVTAEGDAKSRQAIRRLHRENPHARIVVMGCYATRAPDEVAVLPGVAEVVTDKRELPDLLGRYGVVDLPTGISGLTGRSRAYVKVQDGCLLRCSYCIIPTVRPQMASRPQADIMAEVERLLMRGYREIVLTGIHLGHYGVDFNSGRSRGEWTRLATLLKTLCGLAPDHRFRIRLSSIEATEVTRQLLETMQDHAPRVCRHLHVCLQSGSDRVLRRMRRRWNVKRIVDRVRLAQDHLPGLAVTTDVIVGFPGETEEDFQQTLEVCRTIGFSKIHIFPFSPRRGTDAATYPDQISAKTKQERVARLTALEAELRGRFLQSLVGQHVEILIERQEPHWIMGTTCRFAPCRTVVTSDTPTMKPGDLIRCRVIGHDGQAFSGAID
ncbi:MAG TPA: tRNA (N(6)-L-threonylcarbamoyladenosine(37)-C(2))-methylthiotransferase MtaB [Pirellulaceae bacterium]|nr:tRNA (N(6)-L-threonylcarbamoyladenosine(37)-C(2))-methylthiotransferase MtaB [Pirellulaceae bacterium]